MVTDALVQIFAEAVLGRNSRSGLPVLSLPRWRAVGKTASIRSSKGPSRALHGPCLFFLVAC